MQGYGHIIDHDEVEIIGLSEEHGHLHWHTQDNKFSVGDQVRIIPNHACVVSNLVGNVWLHDGQDEYINLTVPASACVR